MNIIARIALFGLFVVAVGIAPVAAQNPEAPKAELFVGYSALFFEVSNGNAAHGYHVAGTGNVNSWLGLTGEVSGHINGGYVLHYALGGPRFTLRSSSSRIEPFAHALAGGIVASGEGRFAMAFGGGVDVRVTDRIAIRAVQADYAPIVTSGTVVNNVRVSSGVVFRF